MSKLVDLSAELEDLEYFVRNITATKNGEINAEKFRISAGYSRLAGNQSPNQIDHVDSEAFSEMVKVTAYSRIAQIKEEMKELL